MDHHYVDKSIVDIQLDDDVVVLVEVPESDTGLVPGTSRAERVFDDAGGTVKASLERMIVPTAQLMHSQLASLHPREVEVEFGLALKGKVGAVFASSQLDAHIKVLLRWTTPET